VAYSSSLYARWLAEWLESLEQPADVVALSLTGEFMARAILEQGVKVRSLTLISPTGMGLRVPPTAPNGSRVDRLLSSPWVGPPLFRLLTSKPSIRWFLGQAFVGTTPEHMVRYALETTSQPGAHHAPIKFLTFSLFTEQAMTRLYSRLKLPCLVLYDRDPNIGFERLQELTEVHSHWAAKQLSPSLGLPHWELLTQKRLRRWRISGSRRVRVRCAQGSRGPRRSPRVGLTGRHRHAGAGCTLPPDRYSPFIRLLAPGLVKLDQIPCEAPP
jgi:pimeloyl-ACP methyl ester carboxylesterase